VIFYPNIYFTTTQSEDKPHSLGHNLVDPIIELRQEDGMWGIVKESGPPGTSHEQHTQEHQSQGENNTTSATVTVEHVAVHTEQLSSDRVIVLSKVKNKKKLSSFICILFHQIIFEQ
jgi:hypothetical protein